MLLPMWMFRNFHSESPYRTKNERSNFVILQDDCVHTGRFLIHLFPKIFKGHVTGVLDVPPAIITFTNQKSFFLCH